MARLLASALFAVTLPLSAITIQNTAAPGYVTTNAQFTGVVSILGTYAAGGNFGCTGTLISNTVILTAGHCVAPATSWTVNFQTGSGNTSVGVVGSQVHTLYGNRASNPAIQEYDVAILRLAAAAPSDATIYALTNGVPPLTFSDTAGTIIDQVGYGIGGNPSGALPIGTRRYAQNRLFDIYSSEADKPFLTAHDFSNGSEPANFGLVNGGDSGGPMFWNNVLIGVASATTLPNVTSGTYGSGLYFGLHASLYDSVTRNWVTSAIAISNVPEPTTYALLSGGLVLFGLLRRRRA